MAWRLAPTTRSKFVSTAAVRRLWHPQSDVGASFCDLGPGFYATHTGPEHRKRGHIRQLEALGCKPTLEPAA